MKSGIVVRKRRHSYCGDDYMLDAEVVENNLSGGRIVGI